MRPLLPDEAGLILGLPESPVQNVLLENVRITSVKGLTVRDAKGIQLIGSTITTRKGPPVITDHAEVQEAPAKGEAEPK